jgi:quercetin dioxygenase-like cupin family protein
MSTAARVPDCAETVRPTLSTEGGARASTQEDEPSKTWGVTMTGLVRMSFESPEEVRPFESGSGQLELVNMKEGIVGRATFLPGWKWSEHVRPIAGTDSCEAAHMGYFISGRMKVVSDDGDEMEYGPGDFAIMAPGHDAWVVGDEPCVFIDWQGFADYAKR